MIMRKPMKICPLNRLIQRNASMEQKLSVWHDANAIKRFLASSEMMYDPMYQKTMDSAWHHWMQDKWKKAREWWNDEIARNTNQR